MLPSWIPVITFAGMVKHLLKKSMCLSMVKDFTITFFSDNILADWVIFCFLDIRNLLLPPSLIETEKKFKVVGSFSQQNVSVGCAPTHPSLKVELEKMFKPNEFQTVR